ncbi:PHD-zinc-finger like domain-domain-containing protein [Absidia repens]|uniref:PHD-zinc-finger like domain-domain-containing protein n=1 Tax=Absidia repens TaxID=90262 RepID=A0A1X2IJ95_9FUNG|nr:PHD-zinc-finger like domain-domain-containing protein [Absidia repens]
MNKAASTKPKRTSNKRKSKSSGELSTESAFGSGTEHGDGDKDYDDKDHEDISGDGGTGSCRKNMGFRRPENHYIRYIEPTEQSLLETVEYDMDEQDDAWLQMLNVERKANRLGHVSCSFFENVIDKLEKEWFDLVKHIPKQVDNEPLLSEDSACSICDDGECENSNAIVFCDGCNLAVHQDCYGVPYIPEGQWLCRKCMVSPDRPVSCLFCPNEGGAFKQTNTNKWGHLLCAIWIPEVGVSNSVYMEPIDNIDGIPKSRWKLTCYICKKRHGACIQCDNKHCFTAFHVTCARWARLCMRMKSYGAHYDSVLLKAYCDRHTPRDYRDEVDVEKCVLSAQKFLDPKAPKNQGRPSSSCIPRRRYVDELDADSNNDMEFDDENDDDDIDDDKYTSGKQLSITRKRKRSSKTHQQVSESRQTVTTSQQLTPSIKAARAHQHHYSAGAPIVPDYILTRLENLKCVRQATHLRKRCQLIASICRYWSLKRESRRGAPLLKRLHLEPWTASSTQSKQNELEKAQRAKALFELRADLEIVRMLSEQVQKREKQKLEKLRRQKEYIQMVLFPVDTIVRPILNQLME